MEEKFAYRNHHWEPNKKVKDIINKRAKSGSTSINGKVAEN